MGDVSTHSPPLMMPKKETRGLAMSSLLPFFLLFFFFPPFSGLIRSAAALQLHSYTTDSARPSSSSTSSLPSPLLHLPPTTYHVSPITCHLSQ
mmetsp:Transcript_47168/g.121903  ORF Transcript_47168/g.121903 Transcript_47168/m.121903 type:complete len:93 (-) Transcript_47168:103-381(-)